ncbi:unnamed protein product [Arctogadus glacialis]
MIKLFKGSATIDALKRVLFLCVAEKSLSLSYPCLGQAIPIPCLYISGQALSIPICEDIPSIEDLPGQAGSYF